jgi:hypothetical protein
MIGRSIFKRRNGGSSIDKIMTIQEVKLDDAEERLNRVLVNLKEMRKKYSEQPVEESCGDRMEEICRGNKKAEEVQCCWCEKLSLRLMKKDHDFKTWLTIECQHVHDGGERCGFAHMCGEAVHPPPTLIPKRI